MSLFPTPSLVWFSMTWDEASSTIASWVGVLSPHFQQKIQSNSSSHLTCVYHRVQLTSLLPLNYCPHITLRASHFLEFLCYWSLFLRFLQLTFKYCSALGYNLKLFFYPHSPFLCDFNNLMTFIIYALKKPKIVFSLEASFLNSGSYNQLFTQHHYLCANIHLYPNMPPNRFLNFSPKWFFLKSSHLSKWQFYSYIFQSNKLPANFDSSVSVVLLIWSICKFVNAIYST